MGLPSPRAISLTFSLFPSLSLSISLSLSLSLSLCVCVCVCVCVCIFVTDKDYNIIIATTSNTIIMASISMRLAVDESFFSSSDGL